MRQPHRNLFFSYRGALPSIVNRDLVRERQLEDNATKALINVLEHCDRKKVLAEFLAKVVDVGGRLHGEAVQFALQRVDVRRPDIPKKIVLVIAPTETLNWKVSGGQLSGRPDAWIWEEGEFAILLETKVIGSASKAQLNRHIASAAGWKRTNTKIQAISWDQVYEFFEGTNRRGGLDSTSALLISEFLEYIKMIGVTNRTVFDIDDFVFFALDKASRSPTHKRIVAKKLEQFTQELANTKGVREIVKLYGKVGKASSYVNPGVFRDDSNNFWITVGPKERRSHCHLTVRITEQGIRLDAFAPHRAFTKKILKAFEHDSIGFLNAVKGISDRDPFVIRLREAYYANPESHYKGQRVKSWLDYAEVHPSFINEQNIKQVLIEPVAKRLKKNNLRPEIFLVRHFSLSELLGKTDAVAHVASAAKQMVPYLRWALSATTQRLRR